MKILFAILIPIKFLCLINRSSQAQDYAIPELQWGTYKPHLNFALTQKSINNPITFGIIYHMLFNQNTPRPLTKS